MFKKHICSSSVYYFSLFLVLLVFFSQVHPLLPFDTDDWKYSGLARLPYPTLSAWNPTKVFPECFQPLVGLFAAYIVTPLLGDYISALVVSHAIVVSLFITGYFYSIHKLLEWKFSISSVSIFFIVSILVLLHFLALVTRSSNNDHLFYSPDVNCYYNYIVPNMLCASIGLWLMRHDISVIKGTVRISILLFLTFLALFSNLYSTVILIAIVGAKLLLALFEADKKQQRWLSAYIRNNAFLLLVIFIWLFVQYYEANGSRATSYGAMLLPFGESLKQTITLFCSIHYNKWFLAFTIAAILFAITYRMIKERRMPFDARRMSATIILATFLTVIYIILLSSQVFPKYLLRSDVMFTYLFFYILSVGMCLGYLTSKLKHVRVFYPFLVFFFFFLMNTNENTFVDLQYPYGTDLQTCESFDRDVIRQVEDAELMGKDTVTILVHDYKTTSNWPLMPNQGKYVGLTLFKHGIIKRNVVTVFERESAENTHNP